MSDCPVCQSSYTRLVGIRSDRISAHHPVQDFHVAQCQGGCGALFTRYPEDWNTHAIYAGASYHIDRQKFVGHAIYEDRFEHDLHIAEERIDYVCRYRPRHAGDALIDVGCSNGALVAQARRAGYDSYGCDISPYIVQRAWDRIGPLGVPEQNLFVMNVDQEVFPQDTTYAVVQCNDVIEHSVAPRVFLSRLRDILQPDGVLFVDTPDFADPEFLECGLDWRHIRPVEHTVYLHQKALCYLARQSGLRVLDFYKPIPGKIVMVAARA